MHKILLDSVRGNNKEPGKIRNVQNWIGPKGCTIEEAIFVPPTPEEVPILLDNLFMGSLTPIVMIPMWMGYMIYISVIWLLRNKRLWAIVLGAVLSVIIYCLLFLVVNPFYIKYFLNKRVCFIQLP